MVGEEGGSLLVLLKGPLFVKGIQKVRVICV
jgi:hypothetical protein